MSIEDREAEGFSRDEAEWIEWRRMNPGAIADGETRRSLTRAFAGIPEEKLQGMREAIRKGTVPKLPTNREVVEEMGRSVKRLGLPSNAEVIGAFGRAFPRLGSGRRSLPSDGGSHDSGSLHYAGEAVSLEEEALTRDFSAETVDPARIAMCDASAPPPAPTTPDFTRLLSAEGFARWLKRSSLGDDPALNSHCVEARRRWHGYSVRLQNALPRLHWDFPSFVPRARPYDWAVDR